MTSAAEAAASASTVGQRSSQRRYRGTTRSTCVCWSMTSETRIAYGSRVRRHGRSRPFSSYQARSRSSTGETLALTPAAATRGLDGDDVAGGQLARRLGRHLLAVHEVPTGRAGLASACPQRAVPPSVRQERERGRLEDAGLADDAVAARMLACAAGAVPE